MAGCRSHPAAMSAATAIAVHHARSLLGELPCPPISRAPASVVMTAPPHAARPRRLKELLPHEVAEILAHDPRLLVPVGTLEQHGPHLPLGCDTIIIEHVADELSARFGLLRAPTLEYGVNVVTERQLPGNTSLRKKTLHRSLNDLLDTWEQAGVREFILMTSHAHDAHLEALATVITTEARVRVVDVLAIRLDDLLEAQTEAMHGDEVDTSLLLYLAPELVRPDLAQDYMLARDELRRYRRGWLKVPMASAGSIGRPSLASAQKGRAIYERIIASLVDRVVEPRASGEGLDVEA
jgi:creatinine amidohydrolase